MQKKVDLDELEHLILKAETPGEWVENGFRIENEHGLLVMTVGDDGPLFNDEKLIVKGHNALPYLIARTRDAERMRLALVQAAGRICSYCQTDGSPTKQPDGSWQHDFSDDDDGGMYWCEAGAIHTVLEETRNA